MIRFAEFRNPPGMAYAVEAGAWTKSPSDEAGPEQHPRPVGRVEYEGERFIHGMGLQQEPAQLGGGMKGMLRLTGAA
jgi:hypothetical protein